MINFLQNVFFEFNLLVAGPFIKPQMLWIVVPLVIMIFLFTFYFTEYANERDGWDNALGNSIALFFVSIDLLRQMYSQVSPGGIENFFNHPYQLFFIGLIIVESIFIAYSSFRHRLPKFILKFITSPHGIYVQMYVLIVLVYTQTEPGFDTLFAILLLYLCIAWVLFMFVQYIRKRIMHVEDIKI